MTRVLVTGGTGVIGAWVVRDLLTRGASPVVFSRGTTDHVGRAINYDILHQVEHVHGDLLDLGSVTAAASGVDAIIHMASAKPWQIEKPFVVESQPRTALEQITLTTLNVLDAARSASVGRVVYASSKAVFGDVTGRHGPPLYEPILPDHPRLPVMLYGIGKVAAEDLGRYYAAHHGTEFVAIRFATSYGPLKRGPTETTAEGALMAAASGNVVRLRPFVDGQRDDHIYNKDIAQAFSLAALAERPARWAYHVGSGRGVDHQDVALAILRHFPHAQIEMLDSDAVRRDGPGITDRARCVMDTSAVTEDLGWSPRYAEMADAFDDFLAEEHRIGG